LSIIVPTHRDFLDAAQHLEEFDLGLRGGDALHLAIAHNRRASSLVTLDNRLARAAGRLGLACEMPA
jgi:predicted nucleic acid-binding protein